MEAPVTPYALLCCNTYGGLSCDNAHPESAYRPFDQKRSGFVIAEGAGVMVMESIERAQKRGARILGYVSGYGTTCDGTDRIQPEVSGKELSRAIRMALEDACVKPAEIDFISLDGAAIEAWDRSEIAAIKGVLASRATNIPLSCPKSMFGNLLGASGAVDVITTLLAMENSLIPPTLNLDTPDPNGLHYVRSKAEGRVINKALVISRGRGGINAALVVEKD
jgi:3-oxoacyl-[acyl-carrier-protein] synthase II